MYRAYYWLPVMLLSLTAAAAVSLIVTLRRQRIKVMALVNHCRLTPIVQAGWVRAVSSHTLVPGDVVVLQRGKAMCDMVLLQGACLVVESMLSGEVSYLPHLFFQLINHSMNPSINQLSKQSINQSINQCACLVVESMLSGEVT